jgi:hypothetical protein
VYVCVCVCVQGVRPRGHQVQRQGRGDKLRSQHLRRGARAGRFVYPPPAISATIAPPSSLCGGFATAIQAISDGQLFHRTASTGGGGDDHNLDLSLGSSAGNKRGSLDDGGGGGGGGDDETSDQRVPMAFDVDWQTAAPRSTKAKVPVRFRLAFRINEACLVKCCLIKQALSRLNHRVRWPAQLDASSKQPQTQMLPPPPPAVLRVAHQLPLPFGPRHPQVRIRIGFPSCVPSLARRRASWVWVAC